MQDRFSEIEIMENYVNSLIDVYKNHLKYSTKVTEKKLLEARIDTCHSLLNYLQDRKGVLTTHIEMNQV